MSIDYALFKDDDPQTTPLLAVSLSNGTHAIWQDEVGLFRTVQMKDTGETQQRLFHTTIHDTERMAFCLSWLEQYFDQLGDDDPISPLLTEILETAEENGCALVYV